MEDKGKKCVSGQPSFLNRPPVSPKSFPAIPPPTSLPMATGSCEIGWQQKQPYSTNHGESGSNRIQYHLESFEGTARPPPLDVVLNKKLPIPPLLHRNPIKSVTQSSDKHGGISIKTELGIDYEMKWGRDMEPNVEDRRFRRILSNRISAQKSRMRKLQYVNDMERKRKELEVEIARLGPLIENEEENLKRLQMENLFLKERMSVFEDKVKLSNALVEENRAAIRRLKEVYAQQNIYSIQVRKEYSWNSRMSARKVDDDHDEQMMMVGDLNSPKPMAEDQEALNFTSLAIDPPKSLHDAKY